MNSQAIKLCSILSSSKLLVSSRHGLAGSPGFSAAAHRHQVSFGIVHQAGWSLVCSPLELWFQHHSSLGCADSTWTLRHPAFPLVHQLFPVRTLDTFYHDLYDILWCIFISAMQIVWWDEAPEIYKTSTTSSLHWCGAWLDIWGESSSSSWGKETIGNKVIAVTFPKREGVLPINSQTFSNKSFLSKRFFGSNAFSQVN